MPEPLTREQITASVPDFEVEGKETETQEPAGGEAQQPPETPPAASTPGGESDDPAANIEYIKQDGGEFVPKKAFLERLNGVSTKYKDAQKKLADWEAKQAHYKEWDERGPLYKKLDGMLAAAAAKHPWFDAALRQLWNSGDVNLDEIKKLLGVVQAQEEQGGGNPEDPASQALKRVEALEQREKERIQTERDRAETAKARVSLEKELKEASERHKDIWNDILRKRVIDISASIPDEEWASGRITFPQVVDEIVADFKSFRDDALKKVAATPKAGKAGLEPGGGTTAQPKQPLPPKGTDEYRQAMLKRLGVA